MDRLNVQGWPANLFAHKVTIASGASTSEVEPTQGMALVGILMPAAWTAAAIGYKAGLSMNSAEMQPVYDTSGTPMTTLASTSRYIPFPNSDAIFMPFLQLVSVSAGTVTPVAQGGDREIILIFRNYLN